MLKPCRIYKYLSNGKEYANQNPAERPQSRIHHQEAIRQTSIQVARRDNSPQQEKEEEARQEMSPGILGKGFSVILPDISRTPDRSNVILKNRREMCT